MKATIFIGSLKREIEDSNTVRLAALVKSELQDYGVDVRLRYLRSRRIAPGVEFDPGDDWDQAGEYYEDIHDSEIIIFATPTWWGIQSSLISALQERFSGYDDEYIATGKSPLYNKVFGCVITASNDGFQHIQGNLYAFAVNMGMTVPPEAVVTWGTSVGQEKAPVLNAETVNQVKNMSRNLYLWGKTISELKLGSLALDIKPGRVGRDVSDTLRSSNKGK